MSCALQNRRLSRRFAVAICVLTASLSLSACGRKHEDVPTGQVIGKVGADDITIQELQNEFRVLNIPADKQKDDAIVRNVLSELATRKYVAQQAVAAKLDRQPTTLLEILRSREQVLASAYVQRELSGKAASISKTEIDGFVQSHPNVFASREEISIVQVSFQGGSKMQEIVAATKDFKSLEQVEAKLDEMGVRHTRNPGALDSATLPENVLAAVKAHKTDDIFLLRNGDNALFFKVTGEKPRAVSGADADALARRALTQEALKGIGADSTRAAVAAAKFEGDYGRVMAAPAPAATPAPNATEPPAK